MNFRNNIPKSKCDFCTYKVGNECTAAQANGQVNTSYCHQAQYEYNQWLRQQKQEQQAKQRHSWH